MRIAVTIGVIAAALLVAGASSAACPASNTSNNLYSTASPCSAYITCGTSFCSCAGSTASAATTCLGAVRNSTTCATVAACATTYAMCIENLPTTASGCATVSTAVQMAKVTAAASGYSGSKLELSCRRQICQVLNASALTCTDVADRACVMRATTTMVTTTTAAPTTTTVVPNTTNAAPLGFTTAISATLVLNGNDFALIRANDTAWAELRVAVARDLASILGVDLTHMWIIRMFVASLHVEFAVDAAAGVSPAVLADRVAASASNTDWLVSTKAAYAAVSNETLSIASVTTQSTAAPGVVTAAPATTVVTVIPNGPSSTDGPAIKACENKTCEGAFYECEEDSQGVGRCKVSSLAGIVVAACVGGVAVIAICIMLCCCMDKPKRVPKTKAEAEGAENGTNEPMTEVTGDNEAARPVDEV